MWTLIILNGICTYFGARHIVKNLDRYYEDDTLYFSDGASVISCTFSAIAIIYVAIIYLP